VCIFYFLYFLKDKGKRANKAYYIPYYSSLFSLSFNFSPLAFSLSPLFHFAQLSTFCLQKSYNNLTCQKFQLVKFVEER